MHTQQLRSTSDGSGAGATDAEDEDEDEDEELTLDGEGEGEDGEAADDMMMTILMMGETEVTVVGVQIGSGSQPKWNRFGQGKTGASD